LLVAGPRKAATVKRFSTTRLHEKKAFVFLVFQTQPEKQVMLGAGKFSRKGFGRTPFAMAEKCSNFSAAWMCLRLPKSWKGK